MIGQLPPIYGDMQEALEVVAEKHSKKLCKETGSRWNGTVEIDGTSVPVMTFVRHDAAVILEFPLDSHSGTMTSQYLKQAPDEPDMVNVASVSDAISILKNKVCLNEATV